MSVPLTSFFNDVKICVTSYFMYRVSHEGEYCTKFLNQYINKFMDQLIPMISQKVIESIKPTLKKMVGDILLPHIEKNPKCSPCN